MVVMMVQLMTKLKQHREAKWLIEAQLLPHLRAAMALLSSVFLEQPLGGRELQHIYKTQRAKPHFI